MNVLVIAPHADDEVLGVGGTVHKYKEAGHKIYLVVCSKRAHDIDYSHAHGNFEKVLNIELPDEHLYKFKNELIKNIEVFYNDIKPDVVFIPNKDDFNMDHKTVYEVCEVLCRRFQQHQPRKVLMYEIPSSTTQSFNNNFHCNYYETLSEDNLNNKIGIFYQYKSEIRNEPNPRNSKGIMAYALFRGMECNNGLAEGFKLIYQKS